MRNRARGGRREGREREKVGEGRVEEGRGGLERMGEERREERLPHLEWRSGYAPGWIVVTFCNTAFTMLHFIFSELFMIITVHHQSLFLLVGIVKSVICVYCIV